MAKLIGKTAVGKHSRRTDCSINTPFNQHCSNLIILENFFPLPCFLYFGGFQTNQPICFNKQLFMSIRACDVYQTVPGSTVSCSAQVCGEGKLAGCPPLLKQQALSRSGAKRTPLRALLLFTRLFFPPFFFFLTCKHVACKYENE